jgi:hypothetical protein
LRWRWKAFESGWLRGQVECANHIDERAQARRNTATPRIVQTSRRRREADSFVVRRVTLIRESHVVASSVSKSINTFEKTRSSALSRRIMGEVGGLER